MDPRVNHCRIQGGKSALYEHGALFFSIVFWCMCMCSPSPSAVHYSHAIASSWDSKSEWWHLGSLDGQWTHGSSTFQHHQAGLELAWKLCEDIKSALHFTHSCQFPRINLRGPRFIVPYVQIVRTHTGTLWPLKHYNGIAVSFPPRPSALWERCKKAVVHWTPTQSSLDGWY